MGWKSLIIQPWPEEVGVGGQRASSLLLVSDGWRIPLFLPSTGWIPAVSAVFTLGQTTN